jgi:hypothetical protein
MDAASGLGNADILTRTTLKIDGSPSSASLGELVRALQDVPGVLLAEANGATASAVVAHDSGVSTGSLVAAASGAGVHAKIVASPRLTVEAAGPARPRMLGLFLTSAGAVFVTFALANLAMRYSPGNPWTLPVLMAACFVFCATAFSGRVR